jgi:outer membrane receptor protein involved in Fe transport
MKTLSSKTIYLFLFLGSANVYGQGILKGIVTDSLTTDQLKGVEIILTGTNFRSVSNTDGEFKITGIPAAEYMLQSSYLGYKGKKYLVNIKSEETLKLNVELLPDISVGNETILTDQAKSQAEEINMQIGSNAIKNVVAGKKFLDLTEENISTTLSRLPGVMIINRPNFLVGLTTAVNQSSSDTGLGIDFPPINDFQITEDPVQRVLIRGLESKFSNITIDGIKISPTSAKDKSVDLSIFSERDFHNIELHKTITSDEDADATAGTINLVTGKAPDKRIINAYLSGNYNKLDKSANQYDFTGNYGERFYDNLLGVQVNARAEKKITSYEYQNDNLNLLFPSSIGYVNGINEKYGANILLDFTTPDGGSIKFKNIYNKTTADYFACEEDTNVLGTDHTFYIKKTEQKVFLSSINGSNYLFGFNIDWNAAYSESRTNHPLYSTLNSQGYPSFMADLGLKEHLLNTIDNPSKNYNKSKSASINFDKMYNFNNEISGELKFGGKYSIDSRSYDEYLHALNGNLSGVNQYNKSADGTLVLKDFSGTRFDGLVGKSIDNIYLSSFLDDPPGERTVFDNFTIPMINKDALSLWHQLNYDNYAADNGSDINSYNLSESVFAGYITHDFNFGHSAKFITGIRIESEHNDFYSYYFPDVITEPAALYNALPQQTNIYHYNKSTILPNFQMILKPIDFLNLRLAAYKTLIRPDYNARLPKYFSVISSQNYYLNMGNPDLKNADVWNYEFQTQFYGNGIGLLSINAFYKDISGMQQVTNGVYLTGSNVIDSLGVHISSFPVNFPFRKNVNYYLFTYFNSTRPTHIWGFEIEHQANFRYLPGLLKNIVLNYNLTFLRSETWTMDSYPTASTTTQYVSLYRKQKLGNMPEFFANCILGYDLKGFSFRISYFYKDGSPIPSYNYHQQIMENKLSRLDIAVKQQILDNIYLFLNLNNLTNSKEESLYKAIFVDNWKTAQAYRNGINYDLGIKVSL